MPNELTIAAQTPIVPVPRIGPIAVRVATMEDMRVIRGWFLFLAGRCADHLPSMNVSRSAMSCGVGSLSPPGFLVLV